MNPYYNKKRITLITFEKLLNGKQFLMRDDNASDRMFIKDHNNSKIKMHKIIKTEMMNPDGSCRNTVENLKNMS